MSDPKSYVVRGKRGSDGAEIAAWTHDGGIGSPVSAAQFRTPGQASSAADALTHRGCTDVRIFTVAEDGTETPLPSYSEAVAEVTRLTRARDAERLAWARYVDAAVDNMEATIAEEREEFRADTWHARTRVALDDAAKALRDLGVDVDALLEVAAMEARTK